MSFCGWRTRTRQDDLSKRCVSCIKFDHTRRGKSSHHRPRPYHGEEHGIPQAHGLAFSVLPGVRSPPSLRNIFKEIKANFGHPIPLHGCLESWARQGVLLLNTVLTVERGHAGSHAKQGWEACTNILIQQLAAQHENLIFLLWGAHAQTKRTLLDPSKHKILEAPHPSPLSAHRGFLGCQHFKLANEYLVNTQRPAINWQLPTTADLSQTAASA